MFFRSTNTSSAIHVIVALLIALFAATTAPTTAHAGCGDMVYDTDGDGTTDDLDTDDDNDGEPDATDSDDCNPRVCRDSDMDTGDGLCDAGDPDNDISDTSDTSDTADTSDAGADIDGVLDTAAADPNDSQGCPDVDRDGCDDCSQSGLCSIVQWLAAHIGLDFGWNHTDCDDDATGEPIKPGAAEVCDGIDNNCNGLIDEGCPDDTGDGSKIQVSYEGVIKANGQSFPVNIGVGTLGEDTVAGLIDVTNTGTDESQLRITAITVVSTPEGALRVEDSDGAALPTEAAPWEIASIYAPSGVSNKRLRLVLNRPDDATPVSGSITFVSNTETPEDRTLVFPITADDLAPQITVSPTVVDFGNISQDQIETKDVTITNVGRSDLEVHSFSLTGETSFRLLMEGQSWSATESKEIVQFPEPLVVKPGENSIVRVQFSPDGPEEAEATLSFYTNGPDEDVGSGTLVSLQANKGGPCIAITPQKAQFGGELIGNQATLDVEIVSCGDAPVTITELRLLDDSEKPNVSLSTDFGLELGALKNAEPGTTQLTDADEPLILDINETATFQVTFIPDGENPKGTDNKLLQDLGFIKIISNTIVPEREVEVSGFGVTEVCPTAIIEVQEGEVVIPQTQLHLIGSQSFAETGTLSKYEWNVVAAPGSVSVFLPSAAAPDPTFEVNVAGTYVFKLKVWDDRNVESCLEAEYQVNVVPDEAIHVELLWVTPNDPDETDTGPEAGSDLDLHFSHQFAVGSVDVDGDGENEPWFHSFYDCFWFNANPNWGSFNPTEDDDPGLDRDDTDGGGPEIMNLNVPENGRTYKIGVHYWNDHGFGKAAATVRVYIDSVLVFQAEGVELVNNDMWEVATVAWPSGQVDPISGSGGGHKVIADYPNPILPNE